MSSPKQARESIGLNQSQMARAMGVHRQTWVKWERGERRMNSAAQTLLKKLTELEMVNIMDQTDRRKP